VQTFQPAPLPKHESVCSATANSSIDSSNRSMYRLCNVRFLITIKITNQLHGILTFPDASDIFGFMVITGPSFRHCLTPNDLKKPGLKRFHASKWKPNPGKWLLDHPVKLPLNLHCLIIAEDNVAKALVCVCLVPDEAQGDKWKRIGLCHWDGLKWQVAKFAGMQP
jgi:hypothetical protein